jgi:hypothetical protein
VDDNDLHFLNWLTHKRLYLTSKFKSIVNNFELNRFIDLSNGVIPASTVIEEYNGSLCYDDIEALDTLIRDKEITRKMARKAIKRCYETHREGSLTFSLSDRWNVYLILFELAPTSRTPH